MGIHPKQVILEATTPHVKRSGLARTPLEGRHVRERKRSIRTWYSKHDGEKERSRLLSHIFPESHYKANILDVIKGFSASGNIEVEFADNVQDWGAIFALLFFNAVVPRSPDLKNPFCRG